METLYDQLKKEHSNIQKQIKYLKEHLNSFPKGMLEVSYSNGYAQFYLVQTRCGKDRKRTYIKTDDRELAESLAQRDYERRLLKCLEKREKALSSMKTAYDNVSPENILKSFAKGRQNIIRPLILSDEQYVKEWFSESYEGKPFEKDAPEIITANGERVRSKSEKIIADTLARYKIPYKYECPLVLSNGITVYPDFRVLHVRLRKEIIWDHFGLMGNQEYSISAARKINEYINSGYYPGDQLIFTMEGITIPLSTRIIELMIEKYLV